jgi:hypothetical protein
VARKSAREHIRAFDLAADQRPTSIFVAAGPRDSRSNDQFAGAATRFGAPELTAAVIDRLLHLPSVLAGAMTGGGHSPGMEKRVGSCGVKDR